MAEHGTRTMYVHYGCRCDACCKAEHEQYLKRKEAQQRKRLHSKWGDNSDNPEGLHEKGYRNAHTMRDDGRNFAEDNLHTHDQLHGHRLQIPLA